MNMQNNYQKPLIGIDVGGTKISACIIDKNNKIIAESRCDTPQNYPDFIESISKICNQFKMQQKNISHISHISHIGICLPGTVKKETLIKVGNLQHLENRDVVGDLKNITGADIKMANDANCFALSEYFSYCESHKKPEIFLGITLGTGVGGGLIINGKAMVGHHGAAAELGRFPASWLDKENWHGKLDSPLTAEDVLSGRGLVADDDEHHCAKEIAKAAIKGNKQAIETLNRYQNRLAYYIAELNLILDPDITLIGGGLSDLPNLFDGLEEKIHQLTASKKQYPTIYKATNGADSGRMGAAYLWR